VPGGRTPATPWTCVASSASRNVSFGKIPAKRFANMVLPEPGGPIISTLCDPAAATSSARFAIVCPRTSLKSGKFGSASASSGMQGTVGLNAAGSLRN